MYNNNTYKRVHKKLIHSLDKIIFIALCLLIFIIPFSKAGIEISATVAIVAWILKKILARDLKLPQSDLNKPIILFTFVATLSVLHSFYIELSIRGLFKVLEYIGLYFVVIDTITTKRRFKCMLGFLITTLALVSIDGLIQYATGYDLVRNFSLQASKRVTASFGHPNDFAGYLIIIIPLLICLVIFSCPIKKWLKGLLGALLLIAMMCLALTYSRAAWLSFLLSCIFMAIIGKKKILWIFLAALVIMPFIIAPNTVKDRAMSFIKSDKVSMWRTYTWKGTARIIRKQPVFGNGINTYHRLYSQHRVDDGIGYSGYAHNCFLQMLVEIGLLGAVSFIWILLTLFNKSLLYLKTHRDKLFDVACIVGLLSGLLAFLIHSFFDTNLYSLRLVTIFWFLIGLAVTKIQNPI